MAKIPATASTRPSIWEAHRIAATKSRDEIADAARFASGPTRDLLKAIVVQHDGHVDTAIATLQRIINRSSNLDTRAVCADFLAPHYMSRNRIDEVAALATILKAAGRDAESFAFRALLAAHGGAKDTAKRHSTFAIKAVDEQDDDLLRSRIMQRLALAAFYLNDFELAIERARASAAISSMIGADRAAATCYTIIYSIHHEVTGDFAEANRYAGLWREAATRACDASVLYAALAAEYELAVQFADVERIRLLDSELRARPLPQVYRERYSMIMSHALVLGGTDIVAMRTVLSAIRDTDGRSRGEWSLCTALISLAYVGERADEHARDELRAAISRLGRTNGHEPAYERQYRRITRAIVATCCVLIGDHVHANRIVSVREMESYPAARRLPILVHSGALNEVDPSLRGAANVVVRAAAMRAGSMPPAGLTIAEVEILRLLGNGWSAIRIARETGRSVNTVYTHSRAILAKLNATRAPEAVAIARSLQIIS